MRYSYMDLRNILLTDMDCFPPFLFFLVYTFYTSFRNIVCFEPFQCEIYGMMLSRTGVLVGVTTAESPARIVVWHRADG